MMAGEVDSDWALFADYTDRIFSSQSAGAVHQARWTSNNDPFFLCKFTKGLRGPLRLVGDRWTRNRIGDKGLGGGELSGRGTSDFS